MFYHEFLYLRIPKKINLLLECHLIMKNCWSEMHQFESSDPALVDDV